MQTTASPSRQDRTIMITVCWWVTTVTAADANSGTEASALIVYWPSAGEMRTEFWGRGGTGSPPTRRRNLKNKTSKLEPVRIKTIRSLWDGPLKKAVYKISVYKKIWLRAKKLFTNVQNVHVQKKAFSKNVHVQKEKQWNVVFADWNFLWPLQKGGIAFVLCRLLFFNRIIFS